MYHNNSKKLNNLPIHYHKITNVHSAQTQSPKDSTKQLILHYYMETKPPMLFNRIYQIFNWC